MAGKGRPREVLDGFLDMYTRIAGDGIMGGGRVESFGSLGEM
jgi:hypothetical protein